MTQYEIKSGLADKSDDIFDICGTTSIVNKMKYIETQTMEIAKSKDITYYGKIDFQLLGC